MVPYITGEMRYKTAWCWNCQFSELDPCSLDGVLWCHNTILIDYLCFMLWGMLPYLQQVEWGIEQLSIMTLSWLKLKNVNFWNLTFVRLRGHYDVIRWFFEKLKISEKSKQDYLRFKPSTKVLSCIFKTLEQILHEISPNQPFLPTVQRWQWCAEHWYGMAGVAISQRSM